MEFRKMVIITLYARQQKRHRCLERNFRLCGRGRGWDDLGEWHWNMCTIMQEMNRQSMFHTRYRMLGAGARGWSREMIWGVHEFPNMNPPPTSLLIPSLWVIPVHQPQASCIMHWNSTGDLFHIWYYTCFNAILPNHPTLSLSHRVQKTVLYICVSFAILHTGLLLPSF